jgi:pyruvate dehydrogenase E2 component (dihydrolipoamide acetyltransferase)
MTSRHEIRVPDLGDFEDVEIVEIMVAVGDHVSMEDPLITLETDKAAMEVPSTTEGVIAELPIATGMRVSQGDLIVVVEGSAVGAAPEEAVSVDVSPVEEDTAAIVALAKPEIVQVLVPDLGDFPEAEIIEVQAQVGDVIAVDDSLITLETDKAAMDVPSSVAGKITSVAVKVGQSVGQGTLILEVEADGTTESAGAVASAVNSAPVSQPIKPTPVQQVSRPAPAQKPAGTLPPIDEATFGKAHASPSVRRFARELGVNLAQVTGREINRAFSGMTSRPSSRRS